MDDAVTLYFFINARLHDRASLQEKTLSSKEVVHVHLKKHDFLESTRIKKKFVFEKTEIQDT